MKLLAKMTIEQPTSTDLLDRLSFLVGEWRGTGVFRFLTSRKPDIGYEVRLMCKESPDKRELVVIEFDDDPKKEQMFHASQGFLYVEPRTKQLRFRRSTLMESTRQGLVHEETWQVAADGNEVKTRTVEKDEKTGYGREVTIRRIGESKLVKEGRISEGNERYEYHETLFRIRKPSPYQKP